jgi:nucleoside-diphosphate-sugar epimerase
MTNPARILVTGHTGYIGSVMTPLLVEAGYDVVGLDTGYFDECTLVPGRGDVASVSKDIRDLEADDLRGFDAVVHLAALSNDPLGSMNEAWTEEINLDASVRLAELAKATGVERFLFSSSCIMYGSAEAATVSEDSPLDPKTAYARSKVRAERAISRLTGDRFSPTFLRNGTVYGLSPRMRFDTVFNDLVGSAVATRKVVVHSDGSPWRPVVHVRDVARAFMAALEAPVDVVHDQAFNVGSDELNHQIIDLARIAAATVQGCELEVQAQPGADQRTYRTDFSKFTSAFPDFRIQWTPEQGARDLREAFERVGLDHETFSDRRFTRLRWLAHMIDSGALDSSLRWSRERVGAGA